MQCLVGAVAYIIHAVQCRTDLPSPNWDARALSMASDNIHPKEELTKRHSFKFSLIVNDGQYTCASNSAGHGTFVRHLPCDSHKVLEELMNSKRLVKNYQLRDTEKKNSGRRSSDLILFFHFYCFSKYCGACCGKNLAVCPTDISKVETVLKIKDQVVRCRKLIKRRK